MIRLPRCIAAGLLLAVATLPLGACDQGRDGRSAVAQHNVEIRATNTIKAG